VQLGFRHSDFRILRHRHSLIVQLRVRHSHSSVTAEHCMLEPDIMEKTPTPSTDGMMARNSSTEPEVVEGLIGYKCNVDGCGKRFPTAHGLRNHHVQVHARPEDRPFLCSFAGCIRRYSRVKDLQKHIREKHHSHQCQVTGCGISFATAQALTVHEVEAHTLWRCTSKTCSFVCGSGDEMSTHRRVSYSFYC